MIKGTCAGLGLQALASDAGVGCCVDIAVDASAGKSLSERQGHGKARHIETQYLWIQTALHSKRVRKVIKIHTTKNRADLCTKHLPRAQSAELLSRMCLEFRSGKSKLAKAA